jgi:hypothetical protein
VDSYANVYDAQGMAGSVPDMGLVTSQTSPLGAGVKIIKIANTINDLKEKIEASKGNTPNSGIVVQDSGTENGTCGGTMTYSGSFDNVANTFSISVSFNSYCEEGVTTNGSITASGSFTLTQTRMDMDFNSITVTGGESGSIAMDGWIDLTRNLNSMSMNMDIIAQDSVTKKTYWINDFDLDATINSTTATIAMAGRFYDYDYGYVDLTTTTDIKVLLTQVHPYTGVMVVTGQGNSKAKLSFLSATTYMVEADVNGDNYYYEFNSGTLYW